MTAVPASVRREIEIRTPLEAGWELSSDGAPFIPAQVPGTVASTWAGSRTSLDSVEHCFRCRFEAEPARPGEELVLDFGGIATISEVRLNGQPILKSDSMFAAHRVNVTTLIREHNDLSIVCPSLTTALREQRTRTPHARWRTRVVAEQQLRWFRTTLLGRAPGFAPEPAPVGPWRPIALVRHSGIVIESFQRSATLEGSCGELRVHLRLRVLDNDAKLLSGRVIAGDHEAPLDSGASTLLRIPNARPWFPHTHGEPALYPVRVELQLADGSIVRFEDAPVGFRNVDFTSDSSLKINGEPIFCRGVVWTPPDIVSLHAAESIVRDRLGRLRDAGFNMLRIAGTMFYENESFHRLCDELGLLVWQDLMFANLDYPFDDTGFHEIVRAEAETELARLSRHASTSVICGNSEIEQQVSMLGLDPSLGRPQFSAEELPRMAAQFCPGIPYVPSAPSGGDLPFRTNTGIANYFGVGAYLRPLEDARRSGVRFASECLAFSNVPEPELMRAGISPTDPEWKRAVPRDSGAGWDFEDVRDHYLKLLYSVDPAGLRYSDTARYWELSRVVTGEVMAEVFGEWRRPGSACHGGIVLWCADLMPGAGWGILDSEGDPKAAYWFLKRALAPRAVWTTDEGLNGIDIHVANDLPSPMNAILRVAIYRHGEQLVAQAETSIHVAGRGVETFGVEQLLGRFVDAACAYRFGPPGHDLIAVSLLDAPASEPFARTFRLPAGPPPRLPMTEIGMAAQATRLADGTIQLSIASRRFAWGVRAAIPGWTPDDAYFAIEPGGARRILFHPQDSTQAPAAVNLTAVNAEGRLRVAVGSAT